MQVSGRDRHQPTGRATFAQRGTAFACRGSPGRLSQTSSSPQDAAPPPATGGHRSWPGLAQRVEDGQRDTGAAPVSAGGTLAADFVEGPLRRLSILAATFALSTLMWIVFANCVAASNTARGGIARRVCQPLRLWCALEKPAAARRSPTMVAAVQAVFGGACPRSRVVQRHRAAGWPGGIDGYHRRPRNSDSPAAPGAARREREGFQSP
jgi:hypothetical protein